MAAARAAGLWCEDPEFQEYFIWLKYLNVQLPYYGGSVQYASNRSDTLEFWSYHLSTLTYDPARIDVNSTD